MGRAVAAVAGADVRQVAAVAVIGPTASGKSTVAMAAAAEVAGTELVSIDAMQVYRGMDIGTAKPTAGEQARVRHHLIDLVGAGEDYAVARFQRDYRAARDDIGARGAHALLVGGTGLYLTAAIDDLDMPGQFPEVRDELDVLSTEELFARLLEVDPPATARMEATNRRRVLRALEVSLGSGRPFSSYGPGVDAFPPTPVVQIGLRWDRAVLTQRIARRVRAMLDAGWLDEVRRLMGAPMSRTARQALGYHELIEHLEGRMDIENAVQQITLNTRRFAVRQDRWFRRDPRIRWCDIVDDEREAIPAVVAALRTIETA
jgi:tRNA dimethylallyltransferase